ncbi:MAG: ACT domain-containing protein [Pseudomonadota bacterium]
MPERDLATLLATMSPAADSVDYVFVTAAHGTAVPDDALMMFRESEAVTFIRPARNDDVEPRFRRITMRVHSDLEAVGFTAAFSRALTDAGISANVVAAAHHDHVFVPAADAARAMQALEALSAGG